MQRLALAYAGGAFLAILIPKKYYLVTAGGILLLYLVLLQCFNGYVHSGDNLIAVIDVKLLGAGHLIKEAAEGGSFAFEPEGAAEYDSLLGACTVRHVRWKPDYGDSGE